MRLTQEQYDDAVFATSGYDEPDGKEEEHGYCPSCSGSEEGRVDGSTCWQCKGKGEVKLWLN
jgi:DnaJ-class molecular chaperone